MHYVLQYNYWIERHPGVGDDHHQNGVIQVNGEYSEYNIPAGWDLISTNNTYPTRIGSDGINPDNDMDGELDDPDLSTGSIESNLEHIAYTYDGTNLLEMILFHPDETEVVRATLMDNVTDLNFTYLDADDAETDIPANIRTVIVQMTVQQPAGRGDPVSRTLTKRIRCRNLDF